MSEIAVSTVDAAWEDVSKITVGRIPQEMERAARAQPELLSFILGSTEGMSAGVGELAGFIYIVLWRAFRAETSGPIGAARSVDIQRKLEENEKALESLDGLDPQSMDPGAVAKLTSQPALLSYVIDAIAEAEEDENEPVMMSPEEKGSLILLLKTAIDVLDDLRAQA